MPTVNALISGNTEETSKIVLGYDPKDNEPVFPAPGHRTLLSISSPHSGISKNFIIPYIARAFKRKENVFVVHKGLSLRHNLLDEICMNDYQAIDVENKFDAKKLIKGLSEKQVYFYDVIPNENFTEDINKFVAALLACTRSRKKPTSPLNIVFDGFDELGTIKRFNNLMAKAEYLLLNVVMTMKSIQKLQQTYSGNDWGHVISNFDDILFSNITDSTTAIYASNFSRCSSSREDWLTTPQVLSLPANEFLAISKELKVLLLKQSCLL